MWGSSDDPRKKAEQERKKKELERQDKAKKAKKDRKLKAKRAEEIKKKRDEGRKEVEEANPELSEGDKDSGIESISTPPPVLRRAGFGGASMSFTSINPVTGQNLGGEKKNYFPPNSSQPGVDKQNESENDSHRQSAAPSPPQPSYPALKRPF
ncbi:hypothetical protein EBR25_00365 [bacterium]|jgi:hypothetical protein|nr:hypothetical protein [bacterium]